jgi:hypothetical protein
MKAEHKHPMMKQIGRRKQLRSHWHISFADYELLKTLHHRNISTMQIMAVISDFHGGIGNLSYNNKDVSNLRSHLMMGFHLRDMEATLEYFQKQQSESPNFFYVVKIDSDNDVRGLF